MIKGGDTMGMGEILESIWNLPWYKVLVIAAADDAILFLKMWWAIVLIVLVGMFIAWGER